MSGFDLSAGEKYLRTLDFGSTFDTVNFNQ